MKSFPLLAHVRVMTLAASVVLLKQFAIADADGKFVWADAKIAGGSVLVSSAQVSTPTAVRYAWADNPAGCNLNNGAGLPAAPFRPHKPDPQSPENSR